MDIIILNQKEVERIIFHLEQAYDSYEEYDMVEHKSDCGQLIDYLKSIKERD